MRKGIGWEASVSCGDHTRNNDDNNKIMIIKYNNTFDRKDVFISCFGKNITNCSNVYLMTRIRIRTQKLLFLLVL